VTQAEGRLGVTVWNEGPGFREQDRPALFRKFSRLAVPDYRQIRGSGVGLYTAWRLITLHGGHIHARSEYGHWAEFTFEVPRKRPPSLPEA